MSMTSQDDQISGHEIEGNTFFCLLLLVVSLRIEYARFVTGNDV